MRILCFTFLATIIALGTGFILGLKYSNREIVKFKNMSDKHLDLFKISVKWIRDYDKIQQYFNNSEHKRIAIYGMSYLGDCLEEVLIKSGCSAVYGIDRTAVRLYNPHIPIYSMEDNLPDVDIVIVTAIMYYEQIKCELETKMGSQVDIISLEDILYL